MFTRVFRCIEEVYVQTVEPMDATNESLVHMLEVDSAKLCETTEGLMNGKLVLERVRQVVASMIDKCKHKEDTQDQHIEEPVPEMTVIDDRDEPSKDEPEHQEDEHPESSP